MNGFIRPSLAPRCAGTISREMAFRWCLSTALAARHPTIIPALPAIPRSANGAKYSSICRASAIAINRACLSYNIHEQALVLEQFLSHLRPAALRAVRA